MLAIMTSAEAVQFHERGEFTIANPGNSGSGVGLQACAAGADAYATVP
jgi:hypothetical protein